MATEVPLRRLSPRPPPHGAGRGCDRRGVGGAGSAGRGLTPFEALAAEPAASGPRRAARTPAGFGAVALVGLLVLVLFVGVPVRVEAGQELTLVAVVQGNAVFPATDGQYVAWLAPREGDPWFSDVYVAALDDRRPVRLTGGPAQRSGLDLSHGTLVWSERPCPTCPADVVGVRIETGERLVVASTLDDETSPAIWRRWVAWLSTDGARQRLLLRDLGTMGAPETLALAERDQHRVLGPPRVQSGLVVWLEAARSSAESPKWDWRLMARRVATSDPPVVVAEGAGAASLPGYAVGGDLVVVVTGETVSVVDLVSGTERALPGPALPGHPPATDGQFVFWERSAATDGSRIDLLAFDLASDSLFDVAVNSGANTLPQAEDGALAWQRDTGASVEVHAARVSDLLPSAPRPAPVTSSDAWVYFPETGHFLANGFLAFWTRHGGVERFGYPITEEFSEWDPESGRFRTVQYFERARFVYYPEHAGTALEVELARVGVEEAASWGFLDSRAFQSLLAWDRTDEGCAFFPETGHTVCGAFLSYWQSHGLDLGDPAVSEREAIALFGYPVSEVFTDPATGLTVQYFERARFEWHPEGEGGSGRVELGRVGATLLAERGWRGQAQSSP